MNNNSLTVSKIRRCKEDRKSLTGPELDAGLMDDSQKDWRQKDSIGGDGETDGDLDFATLEGL